MNQPKVNEPIQTLNADIRNKLTPFVNLITMIENGLLKGTIDAHLLVKDEIDQCKENIEYLKGVESKETELYELLHKELMDARVKISMKLKGAVHHTVLNDVDDVMSDLTMKTPLKAIRLFNPNAS